MKIHHILFLLLASMGLLFCNSPQHAISIEEPDFNDHFFNKENIPVVRGKILNLSEEEVESIQISYAISTPLQLLQINKTGKLNSDGTFDLELDYPFPYQQIWFSVKDLFYAKVYAHSDLFIELDANILKSQGGINFNGPGVTYLGSDGALNNYLNNHVLFKRERQLETNSEIFKLKRDTNLEEHIFKTRHDSLYVILQSIDEEFFSQNTPGFSWVVVNERQSSYYTDICNRHWGKEMNPELFREVNGHKPYFTSNEGMSFYKGLYAYLFRQTAIRDGKELYAFRGYSQLDPYQISLLDSLYMIEERKGENPPFAPNRYKFLHRKAHQFLEDTLMIENTNKTIQLLDSLFESPKSDLLKFNINNSSKSPKEEKWMAETVLGTMQTEWCKAIIEDRYNKSLEKIAAVNKILEKERTFHTTAQLGESVGEMPFGAKLYQVDTDTLDANILLASLQQSFEHKALLIDFWATWCKPCLQAMPHSKKLQEESKNLPIEFVYLCTSQSSNLDLWKEKIAEYEIGGTHIFVEQDIEHKLMEFFSVSGFPSYVLIDTNGVYKAGMVGNLHELDKSRLEELIR